MHSMSPVLESIQYVVYYRMQSDTVPAHISICGTQITFFAVKKFNMQH